MTKLLKAAKGTAKALEPVAIVGTYLTFLTYLLNLTVHMLTGHYFHWFAAALVLLVGQALIKLVLPDAAVGWHSGRIKIEQRAAASDTFAQLAAIIAKQDEAHKEASTGAYL